jgi:hypothetical protein
LIGLEIAIVCCHLWHMAKFKATDSCGHVYTQSSHTFYTHCVVIHIRGRLAQDGLVAREAYSRAEWAGSLARAQKKARGWSSRNYVEGVDLVEAHAIFD